ncbi:cation-transporting P-type ATPase [Novosphingobium sp. CECT 9465]|uniref:cation-transporting P-type ATPase n=1 Tax=Novosphingobium sp. CECT 9465 TaxID=2829794 RepID=UPI001E41529B|nr:cation-transporting P-type ATPase [Novosphingobium sp. CECT 9465]CAH0498724.1 putative cation-transporting ATPase F [Novosphingobium sp. CECT 9465]
MIASQHRFHASTTQDVLQALDAAPGGLDEATAAERLHKFGANSLPQARQRNALVRFVQHFHNILIYVLMASALTTAMLGHWIDTGVILAVVIANAVIGFIQEGRAENAMAAIRDMLAPHTAVLREGARRTIAATDLVPGDIVLLEAGDKVPADLRLIEARALRIEEAILTGESVPTDKDTPPVASDAALGDRSSMAFSGTLVVAGTGKGVVAATGLQSEIGQISGMLARVETLTTPLVRQMDMFARWLTAFILVVGAGLLVFGVFVRQMPFAEIFMIVVGLSVAAIPEGLPAVLTITLAVGVQAMARRNAIVRRLPAIETLGSVSVICTDKTGTLTRNEMVVGSLATGAGHFSVDGQGYAPIGAIRLNGAEEGSARYPVLTEFALCARLCNDAALVCRGDTWCAEGDPMEGALLALAGKIEAEEGDNAAVFTRIDAIPFDAMWRYMAVLSHDSAGRTLVHVKGAPEAVLPMCADQFTHGLGTAPLDTPYWQSMIGHMAAQGQRVIALAMRAVPQQQTVLGASDLDSTLTLIGLVGLIDPPRTEAIAAVAECHRAGISVKMITGDHGATARAIAAMIGLRNTDDVLTGADIAGLSDADLALAVMRVDVFARTSPADKLRLVTALQSRGLVVAMTGDGVNDAPALKRADAGTAMGIKGSEAAKEAAELVLADDNFASIAAAVREGRTVYDNIQKVISWTLPTNAGEALTVMVALLAGMTLPVSAVQILWINLITATTLGIALAFEPSERGTMQRPPRPRDAPLLSGELVWHILLVSLLFVAFVFGIFAYARAQGYSVALAQTMAVNMLVVLEIFHLFFIRNIYGTSLTWKAVRGTPAVWLSVMVVTVGQFAITYVPVLQKVFGTEAVSLADGVLIVAAGAAFFALVEIEKQMRLAFRQGPTRQSELLR